MAHLRNDFVTCVVWDSVAMYSLSIEEMSSTMQEYMIRVRIAPSPTGIPHIGTTRTALFNYLFAKHNSGKFILRIEDTDRARIVKGAKEAISEILQWLGLSWDEEYVQSDRVDIYKKHALELKNKDLAYEDKGAIRFRVKSEGETGWTDAVGSKLINFKNNTQEDFIILKSDGFPTYNFANVVDDHLMQITHVIRGDEFISSTPKHIMLYDSFGWEKPIFAHLPVILGPDKSKLSKRHGAKSVLEYRDEGYLVEALLNYMALLGWNPGGDREIMTLSEMISLFDIKDVNTASPIFDIKKLDWMNGVYIRQFSPAELKSRLRPFGFAQGFGGQAKLKNLDDALLDKLISLAQTRMKTLKDFEELVLPFFEEQKIEFNEKEKQIRKKLVQVFSILDQWNNGTILNSLQKILKDEEIKMKVIYKILTGQETGLPLGETLEILGKENTINRLKEK